MQFAMRDQENLQHCGKEMARGIGDNTLECLSENNEEAFLSTSLRILPKVHYSQFTFQEKQNPRVPWNPYKFNGLGLKAQFKNIRHSNTQHTILLFYVNI